MSQRLEDLAPEFREKVGDFMLACKARGLNVFLVHGYRSSEEQALIYAKGRTRPGEPCRHLFPRFIRPVGTCKRHPLGAVVTNAFPGQSDHEAGRAADYAWRIGKRGASWEGPLLEDSTYDSTAWGRFADIAEAVGLKSGHRWRAPDSGHVYLPHPRGRAFAINEHEDWLERAARGASA